MGKVLDKVHGAIAMVACLLLLFITFSIGYSIFTRQLNLPTPVWVVQFNEYSLLWVTFLATGWVLARDKHVSIQLILQRLGLKGKKRLIRIHSLVGMGLCGALCWYGIYTTRDHFVRKVIDVGSVDVPKAYVLLVIPVGFFLLSLQFLVKFIATWSMNDRDLAVGEEEPADRGDTTQESLEKTENGGGP